MKPDHVLLGGDLITLIERSRQYLWRYALSTAFLSSHYENRIYDLILKQRSRSKIQDCRPDKFAPFCITISEGTCQPLSQRYEILDPMRQLYLLLNFLNFQSSLHNTIPRVHSHCCHFVPTASRVVSPA
jgi:hypothetical protein